MRIRRIHSVALCGSLLVMFSAAVAAQNSETPNQDPQAGRSKARTFDGAGDIWTVLPSGETIRGSGATVQVWPDDSKLTSVLAKACGASSADPSAWLVARTELSDSTGFPLEENARLDLQLLHELVQLPHATGRASATGHFVMSGLPEGFYWFEAEMITGGKIIQWWKHVTFMSLPIAGTKPVNSGMDMGPRQATYAQFCTTPEPGIGAAAFEDDKPSLSSTRVYHGNEVDRPVAPASGAVSPAYPAALRNAHITGAVTVQFVVDATGRVQMERVHIIRSDHPDFTAAVRSALRDMRYEPATLRGVKVRAETEQTFTFNIAQ